VPAASCCLNQGATWGLVGTVLDECRIASFEATLDVARWTTWHQLHQASSFPSCLVLSASSLAVRLQQKTGPRCFNCSIFPIFPMCQCANVRLDTDIAANVIDGPRQGASATGSADKGGRQKRRVSRVLRACNMSLLLLCFCSDLDSGKDIRQWLPRNLASRTQLKREGLGGTNSSFWLKKLRSVRTPGGPRDTDAQLSIPDWSVDDQRRTFDLGRGA
jgi:hypothetical protein